MVNNIKIYAHKNRAGHRAAGGKFIVPLLLSIAAIVGIGATVIWKDETTRFLQNVSERYLPSSQNIAHDNTERDHAFGSNIMLAPPNITWTEQPQSASQSRIAMAFKIGASAPLRHVKISIAPVVKQQGIAIEKEIMDIPTATLGRKSIEWDGHIDLSRSLLAGAPVVLQIIAQDNDKREGQSDTVSITLPEHEFNHPIAKTIYSLRKNLRDDPRNKRLETLRGLAIVLQQRVAFENQGLTLLTLRSAAVRIALDKSEEGLRSALDLLWHAAVMIEDRNPASFARKS